MLRLPRGGRSSPRSWDAYSPHPDQKDRVVCRGMPLYRAFLFFVGIRLTPFLTPSWRKYRHLRASSYTDGPGLPGPSWEDYTLLTSLTFCCIRLGYFETKVTVRGKTHSPTLLYKCWPDIIGLSWPFWGDILRIPVCVSCVCAAWKT